MTTEIIAGFLDTLRAGKDLDRLQARQLMDLIMDGKMPAADLEGILLALRDKGESVSELTGFAEAMRSHAVRISPRRTDLIDTCGTGGDASGTVNISTAAALVAAAMGIGVAKHGNRAVSSRSGSADVLEALGVNLDLTPETVAELIDDHGIGFLFAPKLHPAMKHAMPVRKKLKVRTVFNLLGPLTNPAGVRRQLLGVYDPGLCEPMCRVLHELGSEKAFVVHGDGGLDEVSPTGPTRVAALAGGRISTFEFLPEDAGITRSTLASLAGGTAAENAEIIQNILGGETGGATDAVLLNAGFAAVLADRAPDFAAGVQLAARTIASGTARKVFRRFRDNSQAVAREAT